MAEIAKGMTEGEHRMEEQGKRASHELAEPPKSDKTNSLSGEKLRDAKEALEKLEDTKGDFSKDH